MDEHLQIFRTVKAKTFKEAVAKSGLYIGQMAVCKELHHTQDTEGNITIIGKFTLKGLPNAQGDQADPTTVEEAARKGFNS